MNLEEEINLVSWDMNINDDRCNTLVVIRKDDAIQITKQYVSEICKKQHVAWGCRKCNKIDWVDDNKQLAKPEHISHRGIDIGDCDGKFIKLFKE